MTNRPIPLTELRRWSEPALWILSVALLGVIVYLIAFDAKRTLERSAPAAPHNAAPPSVVNTDAPGRLTEQQTTLVMESPAPSLSPSAAPALEAPIPVAAAPVLAPAPPAASAFQPPIGVPPAPILGSLEVSAPQEAVMIGGSFEIQVGIRGASSARTAQVTLEYDATALQILEPEEGEEGRARATLSSTSSTAAGEEFGRATFRFGVIALEKRAIFLIATATAFDAAGKTIQTLPTAQQEITVQETVSSPPEQVSSPRGGH